MDKILPFLITMAIALVAVAIAYRVQFLHKLVFGKGSAHINAAASNAAAAGAIP